MMQQQANPKKTVVLAVLMFVFSASVFGAAFYLLDGMTLVDDFVTSDPFGWSSTVATDTVRTVVPEKPDTSGVSVVATDTLQLPPGMTEEFALRLWQEQIDSQVNIQKLVNGEITSFELGMVAKGSELATIPITVEFADGTEAPGEFVLRKIGEAWYTAYIGGLRQTESDGMADTIAEGATAFPYTPLPDIGDVDIGVLNTLVAQQRASKAVLDEYANGSILAVNILNITQGLGTRTISIEMTEDHEIGRGELLCLMREFEGESYWFVARFTKL